jgi:hypothetical protein
MRTLTLVAVLCLISLAACSGSDDYSEQQHRNQSGVYFQGGAGVGF